MERYKVTADELMTLYPGETQLSRIFSDIERELKIERQVVCQFIVNGLELTEQDEKKFSRLTISEIQTLEYLAENSDHLVVEVLHGWMNSLPELITKTEKLATQVREKGPHGQVKKIHDLIENCEFLVASVVSLKQVLGDYLSTTLIPWEEIEALNKKTLIDAFKAVQNKDFVQLTYVLEYDLITCLERWSEVLQIISQQVEGTDIDRRARYKSELQNSLDRKRFSC